MRNQGSVTMPTHAYINFYADMLNKMVMFSADPKAFAQYLVECYPEVST